MRPNAAVRQLRGKDPVTVEIELNALSAKPIGQIACENVADLFALEELDDLPTGLRVRLKGFRDRLGRAIRDLKGGTAFQAWAGALGEVPSARVPLSLREAVAAEADEPLRSDVDREAIRALVEAWAGAEPERFSFAPPKKVQQLPARGEPTPRRRSSPSGSEEGGSKARVSTPRAARPVGDPDQTAWVRQVALERLGQAMEQGLLEAVLFAGIKHRARERFPSLTDLEIRAELRAMSDIGLVTQSAGRWKRRIGRR